MTYPLAYSTWGKEEIEAIQKVIDTDMYTMGKHVKQFPISIYIGNLGFLISKFEIM